MTDHYLNQRYFIDLDSTTMVLFLAPIILPDLFFPTWKVTHPGIVQESFRGDVITFGTKENGQIYIKKQGSQHNKMLNTTAISHSAL